MAGRQSVSASRATLAEHERPATVGASRATLHATPEWDPKLMRKSQAVLAAPSLPHQFEPYHKKYEVRKRNDPRQISRREKSCGLPPPRPMTAQEMAKVQTRSRRGDDFLNPLWRFDYDKHRERVKSTRPKIDSSPPFVARNLYSNPAKFNRRITNFVKIERENAILLHRIAQIMKGPPRIVRNDAIQNRLELKHHSINVRAKAREMELLRIAFDNLEMWKRIQNAKPIYTKEEQLKEFKRMEKVMGLLSFYPLYWKVPPRTYFELLRADANAFAKRLPRPKVFLSFETEEENLGKIVIELRADIVPMTAFNMFHLCAGSYGVSYKCSQLDRIMPDILWQGGDVVGPDGKGNASIYGDSFQDENFKLKHSEPGTVSMANCGKGTNGSQFLITAQKLAALDGVNVVVGKVIEGMNVLTKMYDLVAPSGAIKKKIWISSCGVMDSSDPSIQQARAAQEAQDGGEYEELEEDEGDEGQGQGQPTSYPEAVEPEEEEEGEDET